MKFLVLCLLMLLFSACSLRDRVEPLNRLGVYNFGYTLESRERTKLIQVFDDGIKTYFQFLDLESLIAPEVFSQGQKLKYETKDNFVLIQGIHDLFLITVNERKSLVSRDKERGGENEI